MWTATLGAIMLTNVPRGGSIHRVVRPAANPCAKSMSTPIARAASFATHPTMTERVYAPASPGLARSAAHT